MKLKWIVILSIWAGLSACTSTGEVAAENSDVIPELIVVEPQQANTRYQLEIAKLDELLQHQSELEQEQIAELYFRRGTLYDALGLMALARLNLNYALEFNPRLADVYNYLGFQYAQSGYFEYAYDALEALLELDPEHPYVYLNRGITSYYDNRFDLAQDDLQTFFEQDPSDPYRALWLFIAAVEENPEQARTQLAQQRVVHNSDDWGWYLSDLMLGVISEQDFLTNYATLALAEDETLAERFCEAYFYLGKHSALQGRDERAAVYFRLALATNVHMFVEHRFAGLELQRVSPEAPPETDGYH